MLGSPSAEPPLAVLHDLDAAREQLRVALDRADGTTRPGLELAISILGEERRSDDELVLEWARRTLSAAGVDASSQEIEAIAALRTALPGMNLRAAAALAGRVKATAAHA